MSRYAVRTAVFAATHLALFLAAAHVPYLPLAPLVVAAFWLTAQTRYDRRRLDVIALATTVMVGATLDGAGLLMCATVAIAEVVPALLFAVLLQRWRPVSAGRLAASAMLAATAAAVLRGVIDPGAGTAADAFGFARDAVLLLLLTFVVRPRRRPTPAPQTPEAPTKREPTRRGHLTVVR
ncbi:hypothetical protein [Actinoplanes utahensis]|uniref:Uncharacterized protein n=1 Tax=Actinoplanes utahensis TaxID=1869 RepID=A0A0A6UUH4_ACTUT|nr:hypothetical protein [Actinoplanes utahensis]KHD78628.1 hypothetical protein MB27_02975 [Actinoplanes utahensis]GIF31946.1 hypothetical protein Aut01nite_49320 [Actinoplanes utahensis]